MPFVNGNFETGDLTGWTKQGYGEGTYTESITVTSGAAISGTYGARFQASADNGGSVAWTQILQEISTDFATISFDYNPAAITSQSGIEIRLMVFVTDIHNAHITVYNNVIDGESPGVVHVTLTKTGDMAAVEFGANTWVTFFVLIAAP